MDERSPLDADRIVELVLGAIAAALLIAGIILLRRPGRRIPGAVLVVLGALVAFAFYVFATFRLPI